MLYIVIILVFVVWYVIYKILFGFCLCVVGEYLMVVDMMGINVYKMCYIGVCILGVFVGIGGVIFVMLIFNNFLGVIIIG